MPAVQSQRPTKKGIKTKVDKVYELEMIGYPKSVIAIPSLPDADGDGFTVTDGATPAPPPSTQGVMAAGRGVRRSRVLAARAAAITRPTP